MKLNVKRVGAPVLVAAIAVGGCGSSGTLSRSALASKANAICARETAQGNAIARPQGRNLTAVAAYLDKLLPIASSSTSQLEQLKPDDSVKTDWNTFLAARKQVTATVQTASQQAHAKRPDALRTVLQAASQARGGMQAAQKIGATECAR